MYYTISETHFWTTAFKGISDPEKTSKCINSTDLRASSTVKHRQICEKGRNAVSKGTQKNTVLHCLMGFICPFKKKKFYTASIMPITYISEQHHTSENKRASQEIEHCIKDYSWGNWEQSLLAARFLGQKTKKRQQMTENKQLLVHQIIWQLQMNETNFTFQCSCHLRNYVVTRLRKESPFSFHYSGTICMSAKIMSMSK